jgi:hypothetical protein
VEFGVGARTKIGRFFPLRIEGICPRDNSLSDLAIGRRVARWQTPRVHPLTSASFSAAKPCSAPGTEFLPTRLRAERATSLPTSTLEKEMYKTLRTLRSFTPLRQISAIRYQGFVSSRGVASMANTLLKKPVKIALVQLASGMSLKRYGIGSRWIDGLS